MIFSMETTNKIDIKRNGIYYTPGILANCLAEEVIEKPDIEILDPACGEGALLHAAQRRCRSIIRGRQKGPTLFGCDNNHSGKRPKGISGSRFFQTDFLKLSLVEKFDLILMNPPYVRHHLINEKDRNEYRACIPEIKKFMKSSDLWVYFLIKSLIHLKRGGCIATILPWSFLEANYARDVRAQLIGNFARIRVLALSGEYFDKAQERVVLLWLKRYGEKTRSIQICYSDELAGKHKYYELDEKEWVAGKVIFSKKYDIEDILRRYIDEFGFSRFGEHARVLIGVVTGADKFFIIDRDTAKKLGFDKKNLLPVIKTSRKLGALNIDGYVPKNVLIGFPQNPNEKHWNYIMQGEDQGLHLRAHSIRRDPWYSVSAGKVPDAFFPYRMSRMPHIVLNDGGFQCTNSVHRIYFNKSRKNEIEWLQISLLSIVGQLSLEAYSKSYGKGVLKIEPYALRKALVKNSDLKIPRRIYKAISSYILKDEKEKAAKLATEFVNNTFGIPVDLSDQTFCALEELKSRRLPR